MSLLAIARLICVDMYIFNWICHRIFQYILISIIATKTGTLVDYDTLQKLNGVFACLGTFHYTKTVHTQRRVFIFRSFIFSLYTFTLFRFTSFINVLVFLLQVRADPFPPIHNYHDGNERINSNRFVCMYSRSRISGAT